MEVDDEAPRRKGSWEGALPPQKIFVFFHLQIACSMEFESANAKTMNSLRNQEWVIKTQRALKLYAE